MPARRTTMKHTPKRLITCLCLSASVLWLGGCYKRVVSVKSGNYKGSVYEANVDVEPQTSGNSSSKNP